MSRLLIVDDDAVFLEFLTEYLASHGFELESATDVAQARIKLKTSTYDVVISDLRMPGESGLDLLRHVSSSYPGVPFIMMTGFSDERTRDEIFQNGTREFLEKPFNLGRLKEILTGLLPTEPDSSIASSAA